MLKLASICLVLCCITLALFIIALIREDWLIYEYKPAIDSTPSSLSARQAIQSASSLTATFSLWAGCIDVTWYSMSSLSPYDDFKSKNRPGTCYEVMSYNEQYLVYERKRFQIEPFSSNVTDEIVQVTRSTTIHPPSTLPHRTGYIYTATPRRYTTPEPQENTMAVINCPLPPDVVGASYEIDTPYSYPDMSYPRARYSCTNGDYALTGARDYTLNSFCVNGSWTKPPVCTPQDKCLSSSRAEWEICIIGRAWDPPSIVKALGGKLPIPSSKQPGFATFIFPEFMAECDGVIRQWDYYANVSGVFYFTVWKIVGSRYYLIGKNKVISDGSGLQGYVVPPAKRIFVRKGHFIGITYDELLLSNNSVVQVYSIEDIKFANPLLDVSKILYSPQGFMVNTTQKHIDEHGFFDLTDATLEFEIMSGEEPVIPIVAAYITSPIMRPIRFETVQALMVLTVISEFLAVVALFIFIIMFAVKKDNWYTLPLQSSIFLNLFTCACAINGIVLLIKEYDCNAISSTYGMAIFISFGGVGLSFVCMLLLCLADRRLLTVQSLHQHKIVIKPPSALA